MIEENTHEVIALLQLLDDADVEVHEIVFNKLIQNNNLSINGIDKLIKDNKIFISDEHVNSLKVELEFRNLKIKFQNWAQSKNPTVAEGLVILNQFEYPQNNADDLRYKFEKIKKQLWLELNEYQTPLEKIHAIANIIFDVNYFRDANEEEVSLNSLLIQPFFKNKLGHSQLMRAIYLVLAEKFEIPIFSISIPSRNYIAYFQYKELKIDEEVNYKKDIVYYIDPKTGTILNEINIINTIKKFGLDDDALFYNPDIRVNIIGDLLSLLKLYYTKNGFINKAKKINDLIKIFYKINNDIPLNK